MASLRVRNRRLVFYGPLLLMSTVCFLRVSPFDEAVFFASSMVFLNEGVGPSSRTMERRGGGSDFCAIPAWPGKGQVIRYFQSSVRGPRGAEQGVEYSGWHGPSGQSGSGCHRCRATLLVVILRNFYILTFPSPTMLQFSR